MTKQEIEAVFERVKTWPEHRQEDAARTLLRLEEVGLDTDELTEEDRAALGEAIAEADRGEFASDEEMSALFDRYRM